jgi:hypothetical protein
LRVLPLSVESYGVKKEVMVGTKNNKEEDLGPLR